jgi:hypothetical protein
MMSGATIRGHRAAAAAVLIVGGAGVAAATWVGGDHGWAIAAVVIYAILAAIAFAWAGRSGDVAAILRVGGDERQQGLDRDATALTGLAMTVVAIVGAIVELGRTGNPGVYGLFCVVSGAVYAVSLFELRRRR